MQEMIKLHTPQTEGTAQGLIWKHLPLVMAMFRASYEILSVEDFSTTYAVHKSPFKFQSAKLRFP